MQRISESRLSLTDREGAVHVTGNDSSHDTNVFLLPPYCSTVYDHAFLLTSLQLIDTRLGTTPFPARLQLNRQHIPGVSGHATKCRVTPILKMVFSLLN